MSNRVVAVVALGSNLGNREDHLEFARTRLGALLANLRVSSLRETEPIGVPDHQPRFLNAVAVGETDLTARDLMTALLEIERDRGRERPYAGASRTLDLDLVLFGEAVVDEPGLIVPHPRFRERRFVLEPLAEIAPELADPVTGQTVTQLLRRLEQRDSATPRR